MIKMKFNNDYLIDFKENLFKSKKYWLIFLVLIFIASASMVNMENIVHPKMEICIFIILSIIGIFCISFYQGHNDDKNFYKTVFIVLLLFGIVLSFLSPIMCGPDEVEHFVRAEMTSSGVIIPDYNETPYKYGEFKQYGSFLTIQSTLDLIEDSKTTENGGFDRIDYKNASIFFNDADDKPINYSLVKYPAAFAQNPFFGYIFSALGIALAKLLDLNAVWMLWLGRIFNSLLYAGLISLAIKKTPILKVPLFIFAALPLFLNQAALVSIDPLVNGLGIFSIAYFLYMYKSADNKLDHKDILKFSIIILLLGMCKVTYFFFIFLILCVPRRNFVEKKYYGYGILSIGVLLIILGLWSKFYVSPGMLNSFHHGLVSNDAIPIEQLKYMLIHKYDALVHLLQLPLTISDNLVFTWRYNSVLLLFLGAVCFLYPKEKFELKSRIGVLLVFLLIYFGTYMVFLFTWTPAGQLDIIGVQPRYFYPAFVLLPFIIGFNNNVSIDKFKIDSYLILISISFIVIYIMDIVMQVY